MSRHTLEQAINNTKNLTGEVWECGVFEGETSIYLKDCLKNIDSTKILRLFDSFEGMPYSGKHDVHEIGSMKADVEKVIKKFTNADGKMIPDVHIHKGVMPDSFNGFEDIKISVAMIDVDNYESVKGCIQYVYPRVQEGGWIIIDDYFCPSCPGAKLAVDDFLKDKKEHIIADDDLRNPQVFFVKGWLKLTERNFLYSLI